MHEFVACIKGEPTEYLSSMICIRFALRTKRRVVLDKMSIRKN